MKILKRNIHKVVGAALCCWMVSVPVQAASSAAEMEGKAFRARIEEAFKAQTTFQRIHDVTDVCKKAGLEGKTVDDVNHILKAAGQKYNLMKGIGSTAQADDLDGGIVLVAGPTYSSVFNIVLRAPFPAENGKREIANVRYCNILSTNL